MVSAGGGICTSEARRVHRSPSTVRSDLTGHSIGSISEAITTLLDAGKTQGTMRPDADAHDVILLLGYLTRLDETEWDTRADHLLDTIVDGLRSRP
jgi:hypothetical protein